VKLRNLDIIHFTMTPFLFEPGEDIRLENIRVEDVRIHGEGQAELIRLKPVVNQYMQRKVPGFIRDVRFKNIVVTGRHGAYGVKLAGADSEHDVRDVTFENVSILENSLTRNAPQLNIGPHVDEVEFASSAAEGPVK
jgi:hypothetical protein